MSDSAALYSLAERFLEEGVEPIKIARVLSLPLESVEALPAARTYRTIDAEDVPYEIGQLLGMVFDEARQMLYSGTPAMKFRLMQTVLGKAMMNMKNQSPKAMEELRREMDALTHAITTDDSDDYPPDDDSAD